MKHWKYLTLRKGIFHFCHFVIFASVMHSNYTPNCNTAQNKIYKRECV